MTSPGALTILLGGPGLGMGPGEPTLIECNPDGDLGFFDVANVGDLDGDGVSDLALSETGKIWLLTGPELVGDGPRNCRDGRLVLEEQSEEAATLAMVPGDLDGDGFDDIVASRLGGVLVRRGGDVDAGPRIDVLIEGGPWVGSPGSVATEGSSRSLLVSEAGAYLVLGDASPLLQLDGTSLNGELEPVSTTGSCAFRILGDLDGDGLDEIAGYDGDGCGTAGEVRVWYGGNGVPRPADGSVLPSYAPEHVVAVGDLDGDGFDDVALAGSDGGSARLDLIYGAPRD